MEHREVTRSDRGFSVVSDGENQSACEVTGSLQDMRTLVIYIMFCHCTTQKHLVL